MENIYNKKIYIQNSNVLWFKKSNFGILQTHDNIPLLEYLFINSFNNDTNDDNNKIEYIDFNFIPVIQDKNNNYYTTLQTYLYVLKFNEYDLGLDKNIINLDGKSIQHIIDEIDKIYKDEKLLQLAKQIYTYRMEILNQFLKNNNDKLFTNNIYQYYQKNKSKLYISRASNKLRTIDIENTINYLLELVDVIKSNEKS